jgi:hypothetical protein
MEVGSVCPLRVASVVWHPRAGAWAMTVVCKATFELVPGEARLAREQEPPHERDRHWGDDATRSLRATSDMAPFKARADVLLVGHAYAPKYEPVRSLAARMVIAGVDKTIDVYADRLWGPGGVVREGSPFVKIALRYELAAAGTSNPLGVRRDGPAAVRLPNLQPAGSRLGAPSDHVAPIGFGPIAATWPLRAERLGRRSGHFAHAGWHEHPLPDDLDPAYFNVAPQDQQVASLRPDERILLDNLHPEHARLSTRLPGIRPRAMIERPGVRAEELSLTLDTLSIDTDRAVCTLTWRGRFPLDKANAAGRVLVSMVGGESEDRPRATAAPAAASITTPAVATMMSTPSPALATTPVAAVAAVTSSSATATTQARLAVSHAPAPPSEGVELLWWQPSCGTRLWRTARWRALLEELEARGPDPEAASGNGAPDAATTSARRAVLEVLARAPTLDVAGLATAWEGALRPDGRFVPPVLMMAGDLELPFDELQLLLAMTAILEPTARDTTAVELLQTARKVAVAEGADSASGMAGELIARLRQALSRSDDGAFAKELEQRAARVVLERRHYQRRTVLGEAHLRALLHAGAAPPVPAYVPVGARDVLPLFPRFRVRLLAELCAQQDQAEENPSALRVLAIGRVITRR